MGRLIAATLVGVTRQPRPDIVAGVVIAAFCARWAGVRSAAKASRQGEPWHCERIDICFPWPILAASERAVIQRALILLAAMAFGFGTVSGEPAVAAVGADCISTISSIDRHFEGDSDQSSHGSGKEAAHHHAPCSGHSAAMNRTASELEAYKIVLTFPMPATETWRPLAHGFEKLKPPIA